MKKEKAIALHQVYENKKENNKSIDNFYEDTPESRILARTIEYCLKSDVLGSYKDPNRIYTFIKNRVCKGIISMSNNIVVSDNGYGLVIEVKKLSKQDPKNEKDHSETINSLQIFFEKNGPISGQGYYFKSKKLDVFDENFDTDKEDTVYYSGTIDDINNVTLSELSVGERELYKNMSICQHLLKPITDKLNYGTGQKFDWIKAQEEEKRKEEEMKKMMDDFYSKALKSSSGKSKKK